MKLLRACPSQKHINFQRCALVQTCRQQCAECVVAPVSYNSRVCDLAQLKFLQTRLDFSKSPPKNLLAWSSIPTAHVSGRCACFVVSGCECFRPPAPCETCLCSEIFPVLSAAQHSHYFQQYSCPPFSQEVTQLCFLSPSSRAACFFFFSLHHQVVAHDMVCHLVNLGGWNICLYSTWM